MDSDRAQVMLLVTMTMIISPCMSLQPDLRCATLLSCLTILQEAVDDDAPRQPTSAAHARRNGLKGLCCLHDTV